ncbi:MAG: hypothetical protein QM626_09010 [Microbacterium sp.]|uniref:hypothetical protein n=1 Tax=Microbacterium sp. TaxID=51671 RepID=UPI0039E62F14
MLKGNWKKLTAILVATLIITFGSLGLAAPANAATSVSTVPSVTAAQAPESLQQSVVRPADIDWGNVWRVLGSEVECQFWANVYEVAYFPALTGCYYYNGSWVLVVILIR